MPERRDLRQHVLRGGPQNGPAPGVHLHRRRRGHGVQQHGHWNDLQHPHDPGQPREIVWPIGEFGICDGTNPIDGNQVPAGQKGAGYPAFGQPGRATDADGDGVFEPSPCYAWNNTLNGAKLNMVLRPWANPSTRRNRQSTSRKDGISSTRSPSPEYYKPYIYPHPLQTGWVRIREECRRPDQHGFRKYPDAEAGRPMTMCQAKHCAVLMTILFWAETSGFSTTVSVPEGASEFEPRKPDAEKVKFPLESIVPDPVSEEFCPKYVAVVNQAAFYANAQDRHVASRTDAACLTGTIMLPQDLPFFEIPRVGLARYDGGQRSRHARVKSRQHGFDREGVHSLRCPGAAGRTRGNCHDEAAYSDRRPDRARSRCHLDNSLARISLMAVERIQAPHLAGRSCEGRQTAPGG